MNKYKKRISAIVFRFYLDTKKAGLHCCCSAFRGSGIALVSEQATPSPRRYVQPHTPIYDVHGYEYTYPEDIKMLQCVGYLWIYQIPKCQAQSVFDAFIMSVIAHP